MLKKDENCGPQISSAYALGAIKDKWAVILLIKALRSDVSIVCLAAANALAEMKDPRAIQPLPEEKSEGKYHVMLPLLETGWEPENQDDRKCKT